MNKLPPEHIHLLLDEPIYVLNDHFDHQVEAKPDSSAVSDSNPDNFRGGNKKGVLIISDTENSLAGENETFLFKGLKALNLTIDDVAITSADLNKNWLSIPHMKRIAFTAKDNANLSYSLANDDDVSILACHSLEKVRNNEQLKRKFWEGLKSLLKE